MIKSGNEIPDETGIIRYSRFLPRGIDRGRHGFFFWGERKRALAVSPFRSMNG